MKHRGPSHRTCTRCKRGVWVNHRRGRVNTSKLFACGDCRGKLDTKLLVELDRELTRSASA